MSIARGARKPVVYIAGPYTNPDPVINTRTAVQVGLGLRDEYGIGVIIPHITLLAHAIEPHDVDYWYAFDLDQVAVCDALVRFPGASSGADKEVEFAKKNRIPVFFLDDGDDMLRFKSFCRSWGNSW